MEKQINTFHFACEFDILNKESGKKTEENQEHGKIPEENEEYGRTPSKGRFHNEGV